MTSLLSRLAKAMRYSAFASVFVIVAAAAGAAYVAVKAVQYVPALTSADSFVRDLEIAQGTPEQPADPDVVVLAFNEETLQGFPYQSPLDRAYLSALLKAVAAKKPRAIGLDVLLDLPTEPAKDDALRQTLRTLEVPLVVAYADVDSVNNPEQRKFLDEFVPAEKRGYVNLGGDQSDTVRWIFPGAKARDGKYVPSFPRALAKIAGVATSAEPVEIVWRGKPQGQPYAFNKYAALVPPETMAFMPEDWFRNKIVLIGSDLTLIDRHRTPFANLDDSGKGMYPGVIVQANAVSQLLNGVKPLTLEWRWEFAIALALALVAARLGMAQFPLLLRAGTGIAVIFVFWTIGVLIFQNSGPQIGLVAPAIAAILAFSAVDSITGGEARRQREFIHGAFGRYVSPKLVERLVRDPEHMSLDGERRVMSYIFTDVKDFTSMSEKLDSKDLPKVLNPYLEGMTAIILKYDGMVDKFIGDAVFAIFNAPVDLPDHAQCAVKCALEMDAFSFKFKAQQNASGVPFGITRIGVHTGPAVIGNFGSHARFTYTASGDAVNTAARLESLNKHFGTRLCVSGETAAQCRNIAFRPIASVVLKGKTEAVEVFEPVAGGYPAEYLEHYANAYAALKDGSAEAPALFEALLAQMPDDPCVALHLERLRAGENGTVIVMDEK